MSTEKAIQQVLQSEIDALESVAKSIGNLDPLVEAILGCRGKIIVTGMGKSGLIGRKISATLSSTATPSSFIHPAEALHGDIGTVDEGDLALVVSNSGETDELLSLIPFLRRREVKVAVMCCQPHSTLASKSDYLIPLDVPGEADPFGLIPTSSTTAMLAVGDALAIAVLIRKGLTREKFAELHPRGSIGRRLLLQVSDLMHQGETIPRVTAGTTIRKVLYEMGAKRLGATLIVSANNANQMLGIFTDGDLRRQLEKNPNPLDLAVDSVMTPDPISIERDRLAVEAVSVMQNNEITILPVLESSNLTGVIHLHDLLKAGLG